MNEETVILNLENNPKYYKVILDQLFLLFLRITEITSPLQFHKLVSKLRIFNVNISTIYCYFVQKRATTRKIVIEDLQDIISEANIYYNVQKLLKAGFLERVISCKGSKRGGKKSEIIAVHNYDDEDIQRALEADRKRVIPFYNIAKTIHQLVLKEYIEPGKLKQISYRRILPIISEVEVKGFYKPDIARQVCTMLTEEDGIKVVY